MVAARPHPKLAGLLACLIGLWKPRGQPIIQPNVPPNDLYSWIQIFPKSQASELDDKDETCFQLSEVAIMALTNYASLYGGEYSRSALSPMAINALSFGLLRLAEEDHILNQDRSSNLPVETQNSKSNCDDSVSNRSPQFKRRRMRLLLKIIRRLIFSDLICRAQLKSTAMKNREISNKSNLITTMKYLLILTQRSADTCTCKLLSEIIELLAPTKRKTLSTDRTHNRNSSVSSKQTSARFGSTIVA